ncbi:MAG: quinolinate phosphoribosyl transferase [Gemmatimonadaceae bacterium]
MPPRKRKRLEPASFPFPADLVRQGAFADRGAVHARAVLLAEGTPLRVTLQISAEQGGVLGGVDETIALLRVAVEDWSALSVHALYDGDKVEPAETVMTVEGPYSLFAHLESMCLGVLSRRTRVTTNARLLSEAARPKPVIMVPAARDHFLEYAGDAYAAQVGGAVALAHAVAPLGRGQPRLAMVPHTLIAAYGGDTVRATTAFVERAAGELEVLAPVDYQNDAVRTSLDIARALDGRLWGVLLATSEYLVDQSILPAMGAYVPTGVNSQLVWNVRNALDAEGLGDIRIVMAGAVTRERIRHFEEEGVPVDAYGVGGALHQGRFAFLADVVEVDGAAQSRAGRGLRATTRLERVK